jgi:RNA polymerase sigma-70 factor (ECF subfamily)
MFKLSKKEKQNEFLDLMQENQGILIKICRVYTKSTEDYEDLFQEILAQAWQAYPRFKGNSKFSTWLYKVCLNVALTNKKVTQRNATSLELKEETSEASPAYASFENKDFLDKALLKLNDADKAFLILYIDGYTYEEISDMMGVTVNLVGVKINRIKNRLKEIVNNEEQSIQNHGK